MVRVELSPSLLGSIKMYIQVLKEVGECVSRYSV